MDLSACKKIILVTFLIWLFSAAGKAIDPDDIFPEFPGWTLKPGEKVYTPDNLWDIINGAADNYLNYDFRRLYTAEYLNESEKRIKAFVFEHSNPKNTFGIYSQERNPDYQNVEMGAEGFKTPGAYYFITGSFYVQVSTNEQNLDDTMEKLAQSIHTNLNEPDQLPEELTLFPEKGKITSSEKFIANNFLGYSYLHSAFVADYKSGEQSFQIFIINPEEENETGKMLDAYLDFTGFPEEKRDQNVYDVKDPYNGSILLYRSGKYLFGIMSADEKIQKEYLSLLQSGNY